MTDEEVIRECERTLIRSLIPFVEGLEADLTCARVPGVTIELAAIAQDRVMETLERVAEE